MEHALLASVARHYFNTVYFFLLLNVTISPVPVQAIVLIHTTWLEKVIRNDGKNEMKCICASNVIKEFSWAYVRFLLHLFIWGGVLLKCIPYTKVYLHKLNKSEQSNKQEHSHFIICMSRFNIAFPQPVCGYNIKNQIRKLYNTIYYALHSIHLSISHLHSILLSLRTSISLILCHNPDGLSTCTSWPIYMVKFMFTRVLFKQM